MVPKARLGDTRQGSLVSWEMSSAHRQGHLSLAILGSKSPEYQHRQDPGPSGLRLALSQVGLPDHLSDCPASSLPGSALPLVRWPFEGS